MTHAVTSRDSNRNMYCPSFVPLKNSPAMAGIIRRSQYTNNSRCHLIPINGTAIPELWDNFSWLREKSSGITVPLIHESVLKEDYWRLKRPPIEHSSYAGKESSSLAALGIYEKDTCIFEILQYGIVTIQAGAIFDGIFGRVLFKELLLARNAV